MDKFYEFIESYLSLLSNFLTIIASLIAIYIFIRNRDKFVNIYRALIGYNRQDSFKSLDYKLSRLEELDADAKDDQRIVINIFADIYGQIKVLKKYIDNGQEIENAIGRFAGTDSKITEREKRAIISEIKEVLKEVSLDNYSEALRGQNDTKNS